MKRVERLAGQWLKANDWDYQKYGDRRADRSAYDTMMNYEISDVLGDAFEDGYRQALEDAATAVDKFREPFEERLAAGRNVSANAIGIPLELAKLIRALADQEENAKGG